MKKRKTICLTENPLVTKVKLIALMALEGFTFVALIVVAYLFLAGLCVTIHDVDACR